MKDKRFRVAFSFAGEKRDFVARVAEIVAQVFGPEAVLYDKYHEAEFARPNLGIYLPNLYHEQSDLIVVVACTAYDKKEWPGLEWRAILDLVNKRKDEDIMLCRFDCADVEGVYSTAGWMELDHKSPEETADLIIRRLAINEGKAQDFYSSANNASAIKNARDSTVETVAYVDDGQSIREPAIVWRLPRGFIILSDIVKQRGDSWSTVADYYGYDGKWRHATHCHESYQWDGDPRAIGGQCKKLGIPKGDWHLAHAPLYLMMEISRGEVLVKANGEIEGNRDLDPNIATMHLPGAIALPVVPNIYLGLSASGELRDLAMEAELLSGGKQDYLADDIVWDRFEELAKRLRRKARIVIHRSLPSTHPAIKNLEEIFEKFPDD